MGVTISTGVHPGGLNIWWGAPRCQEERKSDWDAGKKQIVLPGCCCTAVLLYCCIVVLLYCCATVLLYCCTAVLLYCCTAALLYCCTAALLYCCTAVLLYCCTAVLLGCWVTFQNFSGVALTFLKILRGCKTFTGATPVHSGTLRPVAVGQGFI